MTLDEFFAALGNTPRDWRLDPQWHSKYPAVRRSNSHTGQESIPKAPSIHCPLTAVAKSYNVSLWRDAARKIGLKKSDALKIVRAADSRGTLRKRLLAACGLKEPTA